MKNFKKYFILIIIIVMIMFFKLGLYQNDTVKVGEFTIKKPFAYRFTSTPVEHSSNSELFKHYMGLETTFKLRDKSMILLGYEYIFFNQGIGIMLDKNKNNTNSFILVFKNKKEDVFDELKCIYHLKIKENDNNEIYGLVKNKGVIFSIVGDSKDIILKLKDDICK